MDCKILAESLIGEAFPIEALIHAWEPAGAPDESDPESGLAGGLIALLHATQGLAGAIGKQPLAAASLGRPGDPWLAGAAGFWKSLAIERPWWRGRAVAVADADPGRRLDAVLGELAAGTERETLHDLTFRELQDPCGRCRGAIGTEHGDEIEAPLLHALG